MRLRQLLLALALLSLPALAAAAPDATADRLDLLIEKAGLERQLGEFQAAMQAGIRQAHAANPTLTPEQFARLTGAIARIYTPERMRVRLRDELARMLKPTDIESALAWIDSPVGRKFGALDAKAMEPAQRKRLEAALKQGPPKLSPRRAELIHELVRATHTDEFATSIVIESAIGTAEGMLGSQPGHKPPVPSIRSRMEAQRAELTRHLHDQCFTIFAVGYAEASDEDITELLTYARSPHGASFHLYAAQAFESTAVHAARELGTDLAGPVPAKNM